MPSKCYSVKCFCCLSGYANLLCIVYLYCDCHLCSISHVYLYCKTLWPVLSLLSSSNPPDPLHPVALLPSFSSSTTSIHHFTGLPLFLLSYIFSTNTFFISIFSLQHVRTTSISFASNVLLNCPFPQLCKALPPKSHISQICLGTKLIQ